MATEQKLTPGQIKTMLENLQTDEDGNVEISSDMLAQISESVGSGYNQDYAKRSRDAASVLRMRHDPEYKYYLEFLKDNPGAEKSTVPAFAG